MNKIKRVYHRGKKVNARGQVSALCFDPPRAINLEQEIWTLSDEAVTCPSCLKAMKS